MNAHTLALTVLTLLLSVLLSTSVDKAQAEARSIPQAHSSSVPTKGSSSQALGDLQANKKIPQKQVDTSVRRIPPSTSNPIQNKSSPPLEGERSRRNRIPRSLRH
ncbi:uncharacterized protein LOC111274752 [Durio zibethinus]|uniref:Uncharacterized protein LOC111274752 n=1 Tax=Durio zibethinus TaxID=66656 RepID=A0A6P5WHF8_DURZI|nr:uncharacterized protein LOC111274752 [Durio zibethinus]